MVRSRIFTGLLVCNVAYCSEADLLSKVKEIAALIKTLQTHQNPEERARAVTALGSMRKGEAYEALGIALHDNSQVVRMAVIRSFEEVGAEWVLAPVLIRLRSNDAGARMVACRELGRLGDKEAVIPLIHRLEDQNLQVRVAAAHALGELGDKRAIEPLQRLFRRDWNPGLRQVVSRILAKLLHKK